MTTDGYIQLGILVVSLIIAQFQLLNFRVKIEKRLTRLETMIGLKYGRKNDF